LLVIELEHMFPDHLAYEYYWGHLSTDYQWSLVLETNLGSYPSQGAYNSKTQFILGCCVLATFLSLNILASCLLMLAGHSMCATDQKSEVEE
jgi:hypothetical protein